MPAFERHDSTHLVALYPAGLPAIISSRHSPLAAASTPNSSRRASTNLTASHGSHHMHTNLSRLHTINHASRHVGSLHHLWHHECAYLFLNPNPAAAGVCVASMAPNRWMTWA